ncbi:MAG: paraquat-inducible protein A, partial [Nitrospinae bacterium]|nr:paraquat-inducible protein A [Nitrospinota bacterium]
MPATLTAPFNSHSLIACHECDLLHSTKRVPVGGEALCCRCGSRLFRNVSGSLDKVLALYITTFILFIFANTFPFLSLKLSGNIEENILLSGAIALHKNGMSDLGLLVFLCSILFPFLTIIGMLYLLIPQKFGFEPFGKGIVYRFVNAITPWSLLGVFMLGVLISIVKLQDLATVIPGISFYAFTLLLVFASAAAASFDPSIIWPQQNS